MTLGPSSCVRCGENLWVGALVVLLAACTDVTHPSRSFELLGAALDSEVSPELDVQAYPTEFEDSVGTLQMACGTVRCLAAYNFDAAHALMTRVDPVTGANDLPRLRLGAGESVISVSARADEFLVITQAGYGEDVDVHFRRVRGVDGAILADDPEARLPPGVPEKVIASATTWLFVYLGSSSADAVTYVYDADFELIGGPTTVPDFYPSLGQVIVGPDEYLLGSYGKVVRISATTGEALDDPPVDWGKWASINAEGVYQDDTYLFAWGGQTIESARIKASTMELLNPPDDFNQVPTYQSVYTNAGSTTPVNGTISSIDVIAGRPVAHWRSGNYVYGLAVDAETGYRPSEETGAPRPLLFHDGTYDLFPVGLNTVALANDAYVVLAPPVAAGEYPDFDSTFHPLNITKYPATSPSIASNGTGFLVAWMERFSEDISAWTILASHLDPDTGAYLDDPPLVLGEGSDPRVASNGTQYLVQWDTGSQSQRRLVYADGDLGDVTTSAFRGDGELVWNGSRFIYARGSAYAVFEPGGTPVASETEVGNLAGFTGSTPIQMAVAVDTTPEPAFRTALFVGEEPGGGISTNVQGIRLRVQSGNLVGPYTTIFTDHERPVVASNGTEALVVAHAVNGTLWSGVLVNISTGEVLEETRRELFDVNGYVSVESALYDGSSFLVQLRRSEPNTTPLGVQVYRFDNELNPVGSEFPEAGSEVTFTGEAGGNPWSVNAAGRVGLVARVADIDRLGYAVKARFLDYSGGGFQIPSATVAVPSVSATSAPSSGTTTAASSSVDGLPSGSPSNDMPDGGPPPALTHSAAPTDASAAPSLDQGDSGEVPGVNADAATTDGGLSVDAASSAPSNGRDAAVAEDAGDAGSVNTNTEAGCSCHVGAAPHAPASAWWLGLGVLALWRRRAVSGLRASLAALLAVGCAPAPQDADCAGTEGCACYGNATCEPGLACYSDFCVQPLTGWDAALGFDASLGLDASLPALSDARAGDSSETAATNGALRDAELVPVSSSVLPVPTYADASTSAPSGSATHGEGLDAGSVPSPTGLLPDATPPDPTTPTPSQSSSVEPPELGAAEYEQKLISPLTGTVDYARFGQAVSLSGDTLAIGSSVGAVYIYVRRTDAWEFQTKILPQLEDGTEVPAQNAQFGTVLSLDGDSLAVGSPAANALGDFSGAVYTYLRSGTTWTPQGRVIAQLPGGDFDGHAGDFFGTGVSLSGDTLAIGATDNENDDFNKGAVYVYVRESGEWLPQAKLLPQLANGDPDLASGYTFGAPLSLNGDTLAVGNTDADGEAIVTGAVYVYSRSAETWAFETRVLAQLPDGSEDGEQWDEFGSSVGVLGDTLAVGARRESEIAGSPGAVYVYVRDGQDFVPQAKLYAQLGNPSSDTFAGGSFGAALSLSADGLFVGAPYDDIVGDNLGAVYRYERQDNVWFPGGKIVAQTALGAADGFAEDHFGWALSASGGTVAIASPDADPVRNTAGAVYLYSF